MKDLPDFRSTSPGYAERFAQQVFGDHLQAITHLDNNAHRALFTPGYFTVQSGHDAPSRSQWNTLKKRMKRVNPGVFVFKAYGDTQYQGNPAYYVDFGFLSATG
jgi:hypothetical protein